MCFLRHFFFDELVRRSLDVCAYRKLQMAKSDKRRLRIGLFTTPSSFYNVEGSYFMGNSFQDQFLKLGLVDKKQVNKSKKQKHQKKKVQIPKKQVVVDENVLLAQEVQAKKKARARELNRLREEKLKKREETAAVRQLVEKHRLEKDDKGSAYRFNALGKIQRIFVDKEIAAQLSSGYLAVVGLGNSYEVVPRAVGEKIRAIKGDFVLINSPADKKEVDSDDPYADYEIPDDLVW